MDPNNYRGPLGRRRLAGGLQRDMLHVLLLATADLIATLTAFVVAFELRVANGEALAHPMSATQFALLITGLSPLWVCYFAAAGLYSVKLRRTRTSEFGRGAAVAGAMAMTLIALQYFLHATTTVLPSRSVPMYGLPLATAFVFLARQLVRHLMRHAQRRGHALHRVVLIGGGDLASRIAVEMSRPGSGYCVVAVVHPEQDGGTFVGGVPIVGSLEQAFERYGRDLDEVVQADVDLDRAEIARMMAATTAAGITYRFVPDQYGIYAAASSMTTVAGIPVMDVRLTALDGWASVAKRTFDALGALVLAALLAPVLLGVAAMVKLTDPAGPVLYRQTRLGRGGAPISVLKFRSMRWQYSTGPDREFQTAQQAFAAMGRDDLIAEFDRDHKVADDPRITAVGRILRRTSLDELPQLFNALRGDLSLIGPRPITGAELERYGDQRASFLALKPGITGLWQVSGRSDVSYDERVKLDVFYVENWSMKLDLSILARTTTAVLAKRGAC